MLESALAGKVRLGGLFIERKKLDTPVHSILINGFHIVELGLAHLYAVKPRQTAKRFNIMISPAAKMVGAL